MTRVSPELWSDFDGTAVEVLKNTDVRNWTKYPVPAMPGYLDFLLGVQATGVKIAGVVTRRPNIWPRRLATRRSMAETGLRELFADGPTLVGGSKKDEKKARVLLERSQAVGALGMLEDQPQELLGRGFLQLAANQTEGRQDEPSSIILLGVVAHPESQNRMAQALEYAREAGRQVAEIQDGFALSLGSLSLHIVQLPTYSEAAGQLFGERLLELKQSLNGAVNRA